MNLGTNLKKQSCLMFRNSYSLPCMLYTVNADVFALFTFVKYPKKAVQ